MDDIRWYPVREGNPPRYVRAACGVLLPDSRELRFAKSGRQFNQRRPETPMNVRDFAVDQLADQNIRAVTNGPGRSKNLLPLGVSPPTSSNRFAGDRLRKAWNRSARRLEYNAMTFHESNGLFRTHVLPALTAAS